VYSARSEVVVHNEQIGPYFIAVARQGPQGPPGVDGAGADPVWGDITGTITNQIDLIEYITVNGGGGGAGMFVQPTTPVGATEGQPLV
jgi:hypothetical protein